MRTIVVGERFNSRPTCTKWRWELAIRLGCMNSGRGRAILQDTGLVWDAGVNLLPPSRLLGNWDIAVARENAVEWRERIEKYDLIVLLGRRVSDAFLKNAVWFTRVGKYVRMPHPSGQNRMWSDPETWLHARRSVKRWQSR